MDTNDAVTTVNNPEEIDEKNERHLTADDIKKLIQSEVDKVRTKYSQANAELQKKYDSLKQEKLTDDERKQLEIDEDRKRREWDASGYEEMPPRTTDIRKEAVDEETDRRGKKSQRKR